MARDVTKVGIVGAGLMASQLAVLFARRLEVPVVLTDVDQSRLDKGVAAAHAEVAKMNKKHRLSDDAAHRVTGLITGSLSKDAFADAEFVIEAVFEELAVKKQVFAELEAVVSDECVLATNTSGLSVNQMAAELRHPERLVGFHFFNPVAVLPLVEVVRSESTDDTALATAFSLAKRLKKSAVLVKDAPAFVVNRVLMRFLGETLRSVDEGAEVADAEHALDPLGLPMSPLTLLELVGPAVALHVAETLHEEFPERFRRLGDAPRTAVKLGKTSLLVWKDGQQQLDPEIVAATQTRTSSTSASTPPLTAEQIRDRALAALAEEIRLMLDDGVVAAPEDIDLCMIVGAGWPFHLGGITPYLDHVGVSMKVSGRPFHTPE